MTTSTVVPAAFFASKFQKIKGSRFVPCLVTRIIITSRQKTIIQTWTAKITIVYLEIYYSFTITVVLGLKPKSSRRSTTSSQFFQKDSLYGAP